LVGEMLRLDPRLPPRWRSLSFRVCWRGRRVAVRVKSGMAEVALVSGQEMEIAIAGGTRKLAPGAAVQVPL